MERRPNLGPDLLGLQVRAAQRFASSVETGCLSFGWRLQGREAWCAGEPVSWVTRRAGSRTDGYLTDRRKRTAVTTEFAATADVPQATRHRMRTRLAATLAAGLLAVGAVAAPVAAAEVNQPSSGTSADQVVAFGVPRGWAGCSGTTSTSSTRPLGAPPCADFRKDRWRSPTNAISARAPSRRLGPSRHGTSPDSSTSLKTQVWCSGVRTRVTGARSRWP